MRYYVTWHWKASDLIHGFDNDVVEINEPITSVDVVLEAIKGIFAEDFIHYNEIDYVVAWSKLEDNVPTENR